MAPSTSIAAVLGKTALFGSLAQFDRLLVAGQMRKTTFKQGQTIFARGDLGREVYLVVEGCVRLSVFSSDGRTLSFKHANAGEIFGEIACLDGGSRSADAIALTPVEVMALAQARFTSLIETNPRVARAAITFLCQRLRETSEQSEAIALHPIEVRLARFFLSRCKQRDAAAGIGNRSTVEVGMSQNELALLVGASRQKVNAALALLEDEGAVKRSGHRVVCNVAKLQRLAASA
jgi:CRP/FNR family transcriptional regulator, cyclic AMP receptor protein